MEIFSENDNPSPREILESIIMDLRQMAWHTARDGRQLNALAGFLETQLDNTPAFVKDEEISNLEESMNDKIIDGINITQQHKNIAKYFAEHDKIPEKGFDYCSINKHDCPCGLPTKQELEKAIGDIRSGKRDVK